MEDIEIASDRLVDGEFQADALLKNNVEKLPMRDETKEKRRERIRATVKCTAGRDRLKGIRRCGGFVRAAYNVF